MLKIIALLFSLSGYALAQECQDLTGQYYQDDENVSVDLIVSQDACKTINLVRQNENGMTDERRLILDHEIREITHMDNFIKKEAAWIENKIINTYVEYHYLYLNEVTIGRGTIRMPSKWTIEEHIDYTTNGIPKNSVDYSYIGY